MRVSVVHAEHSPVTSILLSPYSQIQGGGVGGGDLMRTEYTYPVQPCEGMPHQGPGLPRIRVQVPRSTCSITAHTRNNRKLDRLQQREQWAVFRVHQRFIGGHKYLPRCWSVSWSRCVPSRGCTIASRSASIACRRWGVPGWGVGIPGRGVGVARGRMRVACWRWCIPRWRWCVPRWCWCVARGRVSTGRVPGSGWRTVPTARG